VRDDGTLLPEDRVPVTLGPAITTPEDWEPMGALLRILVDGARWVEGPLDGAVDRLVRDVATASRLAPLEAGDAFASLPLATGDRRVPEGSIVELSLEGLGDLRVEVGRR
jgi:2-keto-4-pentenoate hydratase/2-oxohepta-3-ene-1,7-dioic acid hydratase in catechol pathway